MPLDDAEKKNYLKLAEGQYVLTEQGVKLLKDNMQIVFQLMQHFSDRLDRVEAATYGEMTDVTVNQS